ncbi:hypothetical protein Tco_0592503 [Tanacetum coccineum]
MIRVTASKEFSITFTVLVITASLECLFVVSRLSHESTSSLKELVEVSYCHGVLFVENHRDGENLDKMKEKGDLCILVGYSTQSKGYRVYKGTRLIVESIHLRFDEIKEMSEMSVDNNTLGLILQRQKALDYDNSGLAPQLQNVSLSANATAPSQKELDLLFGPL